MPAIIAALGTLFGTVLRILTAISIFDLVANFVRGRLAKNEEAYTKELQKQYDISEEDAQTLAVAAGLIGASVRGGSIKDAERRYIQKGGNAKIANDILSRRRFISEKARLKIMQELDRAGVLSKSTGVSGAAAAAGKGKAVLDLKSILSKKTVLRGGALVLGLMFLNKLLWTDNEIQQFMDQGTFAPFQANRILDAVGFPLRWPEPPGPLFGEDDPTPTINALLDDLRSQGVTGINDPVKMQSVPLTFDNLNDLLQVLELRSAKTFPQEVRVDVLSKLKEFLVAPVSAGTGEITTVEKPATSADTGAARKIIVRMVEQKKPEQFIGTLFSSKLGKMESFERVVDDEITSMDDLLDDLALNEQRYLRTLPGRMGRSVVIRKNPVDQYGVEQSGVWATVTYHFTHLSGKIQPLDTILLGPVNPRTRLILQKQIKTIETELPAFMTAQEVRQIEVPPGVVDIFTPDGERVDLGKPPRIAATAQTTAATVKTSAPLSERVDTTPSKESAFTIPGEPTPEQLRRRQEVTIEKAPIPDFVSKGDFFVERDGFRGTIWRIKNGELWSYRPTQDLLTPQERQQLGSFGQQVEKVKERLKERNVDVDALKRAPFIADIVAKFRDNRKGIPTFGEFFG